MRKIPLVWAAALVFLAGAIVGLAFLLAPAPAPVSAGEPEPSPLASAWSRLPGPWAPPAAPILRQAQGAALFEALFPAARVAQRFTEASFAHAMGARFGAYPKDAHGHHGYKRQDEVMARLALLKAAGQQKWHGSSLLGLYAKVARDPSEDILVRRQAVQNLLPRLQGEAERGALLAALPPRLVSLAAESDRSLFEQVGFRMQGFRRVAEEEKSLNKWENLPCPSPEEFVRLSQPLGWEGKDPYVCDLTPLGKLGRALRFLESLKTDGGPTLVEQNLQRPYEFLQRRSRTLRFNFSQTDTIARNFTTKAMIELGGVFFETDPLRAIGILIHEARHSDVGEEMGHTFCVQGDIPYTEGGCDRRLSAEKESGAYSYHVYFMLLLAEGAGISTADREYLRAEALTTLTTRFNILEPRLAHFQDAIAALDQHGGLLVLHPYAEKALRPLGAEANALYEGMAYDDRTGGVYLFNPRGRARVWRWGKSLTDYQKRDVPDHMNVVHVNKLRLPYETYAYSGFLDREGLVRYVAYDTTSLSYQVKEYPLRAPFKVKDFLIAALRFTYFLSAEGGIFRVREWGSDPDFVPFFADQGPFIAATGGVLRDTLYLLRNDGRLYRQRMEEVVPPEGQEEGLAPEYTYSLEPSAFQAGARALHYAEGVSARAFLGEDGAIWLGAHDKPGTWPLRLPGVQIRQFAFLRLLETQERLARAHGTADLAAFRRQCGVSEAVADPWFRRGAGLREGVLWLEGDDGECLRAALPAGWQGQIRSFSFRAGALSERSLQDRYFAPVGLELEREGGERRTVAPYEGWRSEQ